MHRRLQDVYFSNLPISYQEPGPFESFMNQVASHSHNSCPSRSVLRHITLHAGLPTRRTRRHGVQKFPGISETSSVYFSPDGTKLLFSSTVLEATYIEDIAGTFTNKPFTLSHVAAFSPDGSHIACIGQKGINILDTQTGEKVGTLSWMLRSQNWNPMDWRYLAYSSDGARIATFSSGDMIAIWDTTMVLDPITWHITGRSSGSRVAFSPNGQYIASVDSDFVHIWNAKDGTSLARVSIDQKGYLHSTAFSPNSKWIALFVYCSWDTTIRIIDVTAEISSRELRENSMWGLPPPRGISRWLIGHTASVRCVAFSPGGEWLISGCKDGTVRIWHFETGHTVAVLPKGPGNMHWPTSLAMSANCNRIAVGLFSGDIDIWDRM
jgi:WD40 repeat protein